MAQFHRFADLPEKLRVDLWTHTSHEPRVVGVFEEHDPFYTSEIYNVHAINKGHMTILMSTTRPPAILSVCHESRAVALNIYTAMNEGVPTHVSTSPSISTPPWISSTEAEILVRRVMLPTPSWGLLWETRDKCCTTLYNREAGC